MADTLKKISYENLTQLVEDINRNFAVVQNSPLYKGVSGKDGVGTQGLRGIRGSQFIFVVYGNFNTLFPGELSGGSKVTLSFFNSKIQSFTEKQKLFQALNITEFVHNDVVVLTNSMMIKYDLTSDQFIDTKLAFNEQSNILLSIETKIEDYVKEYVDNNSALANVKTVFVDFLTYAKNYTDTSNTTIGNELLESSMFAPYVEGVTNNTNGVLVNDHKYFGFVDSLFPRTNKGTIVFGSIKKFTDILMNTTNVTDFDSVTNEYAPGNNNTPVAVFLQDTLNSGLLIGSKGKSNLRRFADIYKNELDELVIKSDAGPLTEDGSPSVDYSLLKISKSRMTYDKPVEFLDTLSIIKSLTVVGNIINKYITTGEITTIGAVDVDTETQFLSEKLIYSQFLSKVFVTDANGELSSEYAIENVSMLPDELVALAQITQMPVNSSKNIITSDYINFLMTKFNNLMTVLSNNYWDDSNFTLLDATLPQAAELVDLTDLVVPTVSGTKVVTNQYYTTLLTKLNNVQGYIRNNYWTKQNFIDGISNNTKFTGQFLINKDGNIFELTESVINMGKVDNTLPLNLYGSLSFKKYASKVIVTDANGLVSSDYSLALSDISETIPTTYSIVPTSSSETNLLIPSNVGTRSAYKVLTGLQLEWVIDAINNIKVRFFNTYNVTEVDEKVELWANTAVVMARSGFAINSVVTTNSSGVLTTETRETAFNKRFTDTWSDGSSFNSLPRADHAFHYVLALPNQNMISANSTPSTVPLQADANQSLGQVFQHGVELYHRFWFNESGTMAQLTYKITSVYNGGGLGACPYVYVKNDGRYEFYSEILKNHNNIDLDKTEAISLSKRYIQDNKISIKIREEKNEITYLDYAYLLINDKDLIYPINNKIFSDKYLSISVEEEIELIFDMTQDINTITSIQLVAKGYYQSLDTPRLSNL